MGDVALKAKIREKKEKNGEEQMIPAVLYGKGIENKSLWVGGLDFKRTFEEAGESTLVDLEVEGNGDPHKVLIYDYQADPVSGEFTHIDFYQVKMDEEIETDVELNFQGEAPAVKELGGVFVKNMDSVKVRCLPGDLIKEIEVDISGLATFDDYVHIKNLEVSDKIQIDLDPETVIALVAPPRTEEELEELDKEVEGDISQVEGMEEKTEEGEEEKEGEAKEEAPKEEAAEEPKKEE